MSSSVDIVSAASIFACSSRQQLPLGQRIEHRLAAFIQLLELLQSIADAGDLHLIQLARLLLPVSGDEGHRGAFLQQYCSRGHLARLQSEFLGDLDDVLFDHERIGSGMMCGSSAESIAGVADC